MLNVINLGALKHEIPRSQVVRSKVAVFLFVKDFIIVRNHSHNHEVILTLLSVPPVILMYLRRTLRSCVPLHRQTGFPLVHSRDNDRKLQAK